MRAGAAAAVPASVGALLVAVVMAVGCRSCQGTCSLECCGVALACWGIVALAW